MLYTICLSIPCSRASWVHNLSTASAIIFILQSYVPHYYLPFSFLLYMFSSMVYSNSSNHLYLLTAAQIVSVASLACNERRPLIELQLMVLLPSFFFYIHYGIPLHMICNSSDDHLVNYYSY